jgi:hypothetical protein
LASDEWGALGDEGCKAVNKGIRRRPRDAYGGILSRKTFEKLMRKARKVARKAAEERYQLIWSDAAPGVEMVESAGGALLILKPQDSAMKRFFDSLARNPLPGVRVTFSRKRHGYFVGIGALIPYQERSVHEAAGEAALALLKSELNVDGLTEGLDD